MFYAFDMKRADLAAMAPQQRLRIMDAARRRAWRSIRWIRGSVITATPLALLMWNAGRMRPDACWIFGLIGLAIIVAAQVLAMRQLAALERERFEAAVTAEVQAQTAPPANPPAL